MGNREYSWRLRSRHPYRFSREEAAKSVARLAAPVVLLIVALKVPQPWRLILLLGAAVLGVLVLKRLIMAGLRALKALPHRREAVAANRRENAQIIARYEQELKDTQAPYQGHRGDPAEGSAQADPP